MSKPTSFIGRHKYTVIYIATILFVLAAIIIPPQAQQSQSFSDLLAQSHQE